jgi:hypothetical protein
VLRFEKALISAFLDFIIHRNFNNNPVGNNWTSITKEAFDEFRIDPNYLANRRGGQTVQIPSSYTPKQNTSSAELFRKGVRRDQNLFPTLKDEKFHDSWHRGFENQAHAQLVAEWDLNKKALDCLVTYFSGHKSHFLQSHESMMICNTVLASLFLKWLYL